MSAPTLQTVKRLFALSRNRCAYPNCATPIVDPSGAIVGDVCHIRAAKNGGPRYDASQSEEARHSYDNLILLCKNHHQIVDAIPDTYEAQLLMDMRDSHADRGPVELTPDASSQASLLYRALLDGLICQHLTQIMVNSANSVQAKTINTVVIKTAARKPPTIQPADGAVAHHLHMRNYVLHLIERYQDYQKADASKQGSGKYTIIHRAIKREFGMKWDCVPQSRFPELVAYLQRRIRDTRLGRNLNAKGRKLFSTWDEWLQAQGG